MVEPREQPPSVGRRRGPIVLLTLVVVGCGSASISSTVPVSSPSPSSNGGASEPPSTTSPPQTIPLSELKGRILFARAGGSFGDGSVFTANVDGSNERQLASACCARWSWDGTRILTSALADDGQRITTGIHDLNGLTSKVSLPAGTLNLGPGTWSPDGKRISFDGFGAATDDGIYVAAVSGASLVRLTHHRGQTVDFTPDGTRVIFFEGVPAWTTDNPDEPNGKLFVVSADGSGAPVPITPADLQSGNLGGYVARLSRDGEWLLFAAEADAVHGPRALWKIHVDGTGLTKIYDPASAGVVLSPTWSPDGRYIMVAVDPSGTFSANNPPNTLAVIRADGSALTSVVKTPDYKVGPDWTA